jgi:pilus assembly protein CpaE
MATHPTQIRVLLAPPDPQRGELVTADQIRTILEALRQEFHYVIVDTPASFQDRSLAALDLAQRVITLMTLEMHCIRNVKLFLEVADLLGYPADKVMLVLNKATNRTGIRAEDVEKHLQRKLALQIGDAAQEMTLAINQGTPLILAKPNHQVSKDIMNLARELVAKSSKEAAASKEAAKSRGLLGGLIPRR